MGGQLTQVQKDFNPHVSQKQVYVEYRIRVINRFRIAMPLQVAKPLRFGSPLRWTLLMSLRF